ncbi:MAG TPA: 2-oxoglutarate dehydrogenase complex dihydrolipoyllysine-residue succinyltransferase [Verrucomicrobiae bacterium]|jgi:2-oxoglutarate dehydrogenase E2 component (dihydrolipoamide succinyltransferase)|nr:2-oxoglutarate dehydrogenase complex dihydrolipoyllysine-residue succinyltransferase [Verrucomicrobiae bacterium]
MAIELKVPEIGESITEVEIGGWLKKAGEPVRKDEPVVTLESEKATVELPAPDAGTMGKVLKQQGDTAKIGEVIAYLEPAKTDGSAEKKAEKDAKATAEKAPPKKSEPEEKKPEAKAEEDPASPRPVPVRAAQDKTRSERLREGQDPEETLAMAERKTASSQPAKPAPQRAGPEAGAPGRQEEVVPMSKLRRTVAERLVEAQHNAALLTTFNEIDMSSVMALRKEHGEAFQKKYNVKLGFMSFFVKAAIDGLRQFPGINAEVRGTDIVYHNYFDIGVAIGSGKGLVVPVLRNAERLSFAEIELAIGDLGRRAQENKLKPDELQGGTFTITNGGVYGSLLSTPIVNPPQSGVLGMHGIQERPVAREGQVVIRPMMYVALTYDHRIVDGREAVTFLKRVKDAIENPARMLIEV